MRFVREVLLPLWCNGRAVCYQWSSVHFHQCIKEARFSQWIYWRKSAEETRRKWSRFLKKMSTSECMECSCLNCQCGDKCQCVEQCKGQDDCCPCICIQIGCDGSSCQCDKDKCFCTKGCCVTVECSRCGELLCTPCYCSITLSSPLYNSQLCLWSIMCLWGSV